MSDALDKLRCFWNARYAGQGYAYGTAPNSFLVQHTPALPAGATALCLADGEGRNGVWLARQGAVVTSMDLATEGLAKAQSLAAQAGVPLHTVPADVCTAEIGSACWDLIASIFLHLPAGPRRALHQRCAAALKPGGMFLFEAYGPGQLLQGTGGPKEPALLAALSAVEADFDGLPDIEVLHRFHGVRPVHEGPLHQGEGEVVQLVWRRASSTSRSTRSRPNGGKASS